MNLHRSRDRAPQVLGVEEEVSHGGHQMGHQRRDHEPPFHRCHRRAQHHRERDARPRRSPAAGVRCRAAGATPRATQNSSGSSRIHSPSTTCAPASSPSPARSPSLSAHPRRLLIGAVCSHPRRLPVRARPPSAPPAHRRPSGRPRRLLIGARSAHPRRLLIRAACQSAPARSSAPSAHPRLSAHHRRPLVRSRPLNRAAPVRPAAEPPPPGTLERPLAHRPLGARCPPARNPR